LVDSPGLGDNNLPLHQWLDIYNKTFKANTPDVDLILLVIEKSKRVSAKETIAFSIL
jgi:GTPase Era involved in 16S rRNA processing